MTRYTLKDKLRIYVLPVLVGWIMRLWFGTVRAEIHHKDIYEDVVLGRKDGRHIVLGIWHRNIIFFSYFFRNIKTKLTLVSTSKDGDIAAGMAPRFGYKPIRGSSFRGGTRALITLISEMRRSDEKCVCFTAIDGSRKPARKAETGMIFLAQKTGAVIAPVSFSGKRLITFHKAWDQAILPMPFSKVLVDFTQPIEIPSKMSGDEMEAKRQEVEDVLNELADRVDGMCGYKCFTSSSG
ncbi:MAG: lysophospholipid acyltransferase family protein [Desulfobacterales bacterium]|nr:lysophospholipid acyltransferase family protein [Desulfobacterales bacterium]